MRKTLAIATLIMSFAAVPASASCVYNGIYYEAGAQLCFDGWLQECTVADYWGAIGMCHAPDQLDQKVDARPLADKLLAMALGTEPQTNASQPRILKAN